MDDLPELTELYTAVLEADGYTLRAFHDRADALDALRAERRKPDLLITDYRGRSMLVEPFLHQCLLIHPSLRILMATGFSQADVRFLQARPGRFIRKPFTGEELRQEVRAALAV